MSAIDPPVFTLPISDRQVTIDTGELLFPAIVLAFCSVYYIDTRGLPDRSLLYAEPLLYITAALAVITVFGHAVSIADREGTGEPPDAGSGPGSGADERGETWTEGMGDGEEHFGLPNAVGLVVLTLGYVIGIGVLGFLSSTIAFLALTLYMFGERNPIVILVYAVGFALVVWIVFVQWLRVPL